MMASLPPYLSRARQLYTFSFWVDAFLAFALVFLAGHALVNYTPWRMTWNVTASIPKGLYLSRALGKYEIPVKGQIACFKYEEPAKFKGRAYFKEGFTLCKPLVATVAAQVFQEGDTLFAIDADTNERKALAKVARHDSAGRPVSPFFGKTPYRLSQDEYLLVAGAKPNSLDSRYLGPLKREQLVQNVYPVLTWK